MPKTKEPAAWVMHQPTITFWQARRAWLLHHGTYLSIETTPSAVFRAIVLDAYPQARYSLFLKQLYPLDIVERWYILQRYPLKLYFLRKGQFCDR